MEIGRVHTESGFEDFSITEEITSYRPRIHAPRIHLPRITNHTSFCLTQAVQPTNNFEGKLEEGLRLFNSSDSKNTIPTPVIISALSAEKIFDFFCDLIEASQKLAGLGAVANLILETSHSPWVDQHNDIWIERVDLPLVLAKFKEHRDLFLNDGCTGIAIAFPEASLELQLDDHKLTYIYSNNQDWALILLKKYGVTPKPNLNFITEAAHIHSTDEDFEQEFFSLCREFGKEVYYDEF